MQQAKNKDGISVNVGYEGTSKARPPPAPMAKGRGTFSLGENYMFC